MKDRRYFVTGAVSGTPMKAYLINGQRPFGEEECIKRLEPLIRELGEAHAAGESGFTICPDNLLVQEDGTVVLGGDAAERRICEGFSPIEHYYTKAVIGTWSDVYAMCATLLYCMTGKTPPSPIKRMSGENLDLYGISPAVAAVLEKGLKIRAEDRIQTLGELADSLLGADTVDRTVFVAPAKKEVAAAVFSETPDVGGTIYQAAPEDESKTEIHAWPNINKSAPAEGRTVQQQFEIDTATQSKVSARKAAAEEKRLSETLPPKDEPPVRKKKSAWKTAVPLAVLAVVAGISFFTFRDRWIDPAVRESLPSEEPAQVQQTAEPATAESPRVVEEISAMDTKQLVPATTDAAAESPEPEITYAETKPLVPEASAPEPQDTTLIDQILRVFDSNTTVTADNQETQAVQVSNTAETAGEAQPTNDNNGNTRSADQSATYNAPAPGEDSTPAPGEDNAPVSVATKDDTSTQTVPGDNEADKVPPTASPEDINNMPPKESGFTEDGLKALTGKYGEVEGVRGAANPYYLDQPVVDCKHVRMDLSFEQLGGSGFGYFYLYVKDLDGNWHHVSLFRIEKEQADGRTVTYELDLDGIESFTAIAICPEEKGMDFTRRYDFTIYVDPDCVSEYGAEIPRPSFKPAGTNNPVSATHVAAPRPASNNAPNVLASLLEDVLVDPKGDYDFSKDAVGVCFVAGTQVHTADGLKAIEEIEQGDLVWSWNDVTDEAELKPVVETYINPCTELAHLSVCGETIVCTPQHRFYVPQKGWTRAYALREGDELVLLNGKTVMVDSIHFEKLESPVNVHNFQVQDTHSYYVGEGGIRVHNAAAPSVGADGVKSVEAVPIC